MEKKTIRFKLEEGSTYNLPINFAEITDLLWDAGINMYVDEYTNELVVILSEDMPKRRNVKRKLGRRSQTVETGELEERFRYTSLNGEEKIYKAPRMYKWSDIVCMLETMTDKQIMEKLTVTAKRKTKSEYSDLTYMEVKENTPMAPATYYRKKKKMTRSDWYQRLDKERCADIDYLRSVPGDQDF